MNLISNNPTVSPSVMEESMTSEHLVQYTKYTRTHALGGRIEQITFVAASRGHATIQSWVKDYLSEEKEDLYLRALRNLYRKLDFIELNQSLDMSDISEEEYDQELESNEDKYLIPSPTGKPTLQQIIQITDILKRIGRDKNMSVDEVSEMFSLEMGKAMDVLEAK